MAHPLRIKRAHFKAKLPDGAVLVARPSRWGNPFEVGVDGTPEEVVERHEYELGDDLRIQLPDLTGLQLACYCDLDQPCHADVLCRLANPQEEPDEVLATCPYCGWDLWPEVEAPPLGRCPGCGYVNE